MLLKINTADINSIQDYLQFLDEHDAQLLNKLLAEIDDKNESLSINFEFKQDKLNLKKIESDHLNGSNAEFYQKLCLSHFQKDIVIGTITTQAGTQASIIQNSKQ